MGTLAWNELTKHDKDFKPLSTNPTKWSKHSTCLSVLDYFAWLALKGLITEYNIPMVIYWVHDGDFWRTVISLYRLVAPMSPSISKSLQLRHQKRDAVQKTNEIGS